MITTLKQITIGEYVLTPIKNAFNDKCSYWISKKGYTLALYVFSVDSSMNQKDLNYMLSASAIDSYIHFLKIKLSRLKSKLPYTIKICGFTTN